MKRTVLCFIGICLLVFACTIQVPKPQQASKEKNFLLENGLHSVRVIQVVIYHNAINYFDTNGNQYVVNKPSVTLTATGWDELLVSYYGITYDTPGNIPTPFTDTALATKLKVQKDKNGLVNISCVYGCDGFVALMEYESIVITATNGQWE